jgi:hypothetical protein
VLPLEKSPKGLPFAIGLTQAPRTQTRPDGHVMPTQFTSVHAPATHACPIGHGVTPHDSGWHAPATHTRPMGHEMPTHGRSTHVIMPTQTWVALQGVSVHLGGKHWPFTHTLLPWQVTPAQVTSTHAPALHTKPAPHVTWPQSRVTQRPSLHVSLLAHVTPTHAFCWQTDAFAHTWSTPQFASVQFFGRHRPPPQPSVAPHASPHVPQFASSMAVLTHAEPHCVVPAPQTTVDPASMGNLLMDSAQPSAVSTANGTRTRLISPPLGTAR